MPSTCALIKTFTLIQGEWFDCGYSRLWLDETHGSSSEQLFQFWMPQYYGFCRLQSGQISIFNHFKHEFHTKICPVCSRINTKHVWWLCDFLSLALLWMNPNPNVLSCPVFSRPVQTVCVWSWRCLSVVCCLCALIPSHSLCLQGLYLLYVGAYLVREWWRENRNVKGRGAESDDRWMIEETFDGI